MDDMGKIVICKYCNKPEYYGDMRWSDGMCFCRNCYKRYFENKTGNHYIYDDLDGKIPTIEEYLAQK